jgi:hypothetical protein
MQCCADECSVVQINGKIVEACLRSRSLLEFMMNYMYTITVRNKLRAFFAPSDVGPWGLTCGITSHITNDTLFPYI